MINIGIMQGRLLAPYEGRFQAFPADQWREEFVRGEQAGLYCIEWIYEEPHEADNPLGTDEGIAEMQAMIEQTGVKIRSVCADYYMTRHLVGADKQPDSAVVEHLRGLIKRAAQLGVTYIVLPFVDASSLPDDAARGAALTALTALSSDAEAAGVELHLETDLPPDVFSALLAKIGHPFVKANFDIGNSASLGYDPEVELTALAPYLGSVHVKDRVLGGGTIALGMGNADFDTCFKMIAKAGFNRWLILQAARDDSRDFVEWAIENKTFVERHLDRLQISI